MPIKLASNLTLPDNAVTQKFAFIARSGAGKSHNAGKLVEGMLDLGAPVIVLDPVGVWYGLRLSSTGKRAGYAIPVFGGMQGDVEITPDMGEQLGALLVERDLAAVIDVSQFRKNQRKTFVAEFAESLFEHSKKKRAARHLVIEEAQVFAPQRADPGELQMLGAIEDLCRLGRNFGIGTTLISQRPQSINKEVLNQAECVCVGQLNAKHERDAVEAWVLEHKADKNWISKLPSLPIGTMVVWSPQWLGIMETVKFDKKKTLDASATPELGQEAITPRKLEDVDVEGLKAALAAKPVEPKKGKAPSSTNIVVAPSIDAEKLEHLAQRLAHFETQYGALVDTVGAVLGAVREQLNAVSENMQSTIDWLSEHVKLLGDKPMVMETPYGTISHQMPKAKTGSPLRDKDGDEVVPGPYGPVKAKTFFLNEAQELPPTTRSQLNKERRKAKPENVHKVDNLRSGAVRMLKVLAAFYPGEMTKAQVARGAKMKVTGGTFGTYWSELTRLNLIMPGAYSTLFKATDLGVTALGEKFEPLPRDFNARVSYWMERLRDGERKMLREVISYVTISKQDLAKRTGYEISGGTFGTYLSVLTTNRLVAKDGDVLTVHPWLLGHE